MVTLGLHTATPICTVSIDGHAYHWESGRTLSKLLLGFLEECLKREGKTFQDIEGLVVFSGPGSFTGLRIGITVMNTLADSLGVPIVGAGDPDWYETGVTALTAGKNEKIVLPVYGSGAHITQPRRTPRK